MAFGIRATVAALAVSMLIAALRAARAMLARPGAAIVQRDHNARDISRADLAS